MLNKHEAALVKTLQSGEGMVYNVIFRNAKEKDKFIKRCERSIRGSKEYRDYIRFLKENVDMTHCAFYNAVSSDNAKHVSIEIHHAPFTLYDYVKAVVERYEAEEAELNELLIADEVMELHYQNKVGLIPLSKTIHEAVHNSDKVPIPLSMIYGDYKSLLEDERFMGLDQLGFLYDKLERAINESRTITQETFDAIRKQFTYLSIEGNEAVEAVPTARNTSAVA